MNINNPDYDIEEFWLGFKQSMENFYKSFNITSRPIQIWSKNLNNFQKNKKYLEIEECILNYISLYAIDIMKSMNGYHMNILESNVKRWNKLSNKFSFNNSNIKYHNIIFLLIDIYTSSYSKHLSDNTSSDFSNIFSQVELFIIYQDFTNLIEFSINNNNPSIIEKLQKFTDIKKNIKNIYQIDIPDNMNAGKKIINLIKNKKI